MPNTLVVHRTYPVTLIADAGDGVHMTATIEANHTTLRHSADTVEDLMGWATRTIAGLVTKFGAQALPVAFLDNTEDEPGLYMVVADRSGTLTTDTEPDPQIAAAAETRFRDWRREIRRARRERPEPVPAEDLTVAPEGHNGWTGLMPAVSAAATAEVCTGQEDGVEAELNSRAAQARARARERAEADLAARDARPDPAPEVYDRSVVQDAEEEVGELRRSLTFQMPATEPWDATRAKARQGWQGWVNNFGASLEPGPAEARMLGDIEVVAQGWTGSRTLTTANPKGGVGKTSTLISAVSTITTFSPVNAVLCDFNEAVGNSDERAGVQGTAEGTVRDLARWAGDLEHVPARTEIRPFVNVHPRDKYHHIRAHQPAGPGDHMNGEDVVEVHRALTPSYDLIGADTSNRMDAETWEQVMAHTDQLIVPISGDDASKGAAKMFDFLINKWGGHYADLARNAIVVLTSPNPRVSAATLRELEQTWAPEVRAVIRVPFDRHLGENRLHFAGYRQATQRALVSVAAEVTRGLQGAR